MGRVVRRWLIVVALILALALLMVGSTACARSASALPPNPTAEALQTKLAEVDRLGARLGCTDWASPQQSGPCLELQFQADALQRQLAEERTKAERPNAQAMAAAEAAVRAIVGDPALKVTFASTGANPYLNDNTRMETYLDSRGMSYLVNPQTHEVFQFSPAGNSQVSFRHSPRLSEEELRRRAEAFLAQHVAGFARVKEAYVLEESAKDGASYSFRWRSPACSAKGDYAAVGVVLSPGGDVMSFVNTLSLFHDVAP